MPEAAVDKHGNTWTDKREVNSRLGCSVVCPVPQAKCPQTPPEAELWRGIEMPYGFHDVGPGGAVEAIHRCVSAQLAAAWRGRSGGPLVECRPHRRDHLSERGGGGPRATA